MKKIYKIVSFVLALLIAFTLIQIDTYASDENAFTFDSDTKTIVSYNGSATEVTVPAIIGSTNVEHIGEGAFQNKKIIVVHLPNTIKSIGNNAFQGCTSLNSVDFGGIITNLESIGDNAFQGCVNLSLAWTIQNHKSITVSASALDGGEHNFLMMCSSREDTVEEIANLKGKYYRGLQEGAMICDEQGRLFYPDYDLGYLNVLEMMEVYQWAILWDEDNPFYPNTDMRPSSGPVSSEEIYSVSRLYELFQVPKGNKNLITYDVINSYGEDRIAKATINNGIYYINDQIKWTDVGMYYGSQTLFIIIQNNYLQEDSYEITYPKTTYYEGDKFNPEGLVVSALNRLNEKVSFVYGSNNNSSNFPPYDQDIPHFTFSNVNVNSLKTNDTSVSFELTMNSFEQGLDLYSYTGSIPINVLKVGLTELEIKQKPTKLEYYEGESFDLTGLIFTGHYNNNTTQEIKYNDSNKDLFTFSTEQLTSGDKEIEITYDGHTVKQPITVKKVDPTHIEIKELPHQMEYYAGDKFNPEGLEITVYYNNGTSENIVYNENTKDKFDFSLDQLNDSDKEIEITYLNKSINTSMTVHPLIVESIEVKEPSTQLEYYEEDIFDSSGLILTVQYNSGRIEDISYSKETKNDFIFSLNELNIDDKEIEITYKNKTVKQLITVKARYTKDEIKKDNIIINGELDVHSTLTVEVTKDYENHFGVINDGKVLGSYEVKLTGKYRGNLQLTFEVGTEYNGKTAYILHKKKDGAIEKFEEVVKDGQVIVTVNELSPFIIYIDKEKTDINDNQEVLPPIIKPVIPTVPPISDIEPPIHQNDNLLENPNNEINVVKQPLTTHNNENNIPTGDYTTMVPYISALVIGILGTGYYLFKRKQREKYGRK